MTYTFDPDNPFPQTEASSYSYEAAKAHAEIVDLWLGFNCAVVEETIKNDLKFKRVATNQLQTWNHLPVAVFSTPYIELRLILDHLKPIAGQSLVDLGAGYGRMAFVLERHFPNVRFVGIELVRHRVEEATRLFKTHGLIHSQMLNQDMSEPSFLLPEADYYFVYDFGLRVQMEKTLDHLKELAQRRAVIVCARGRLSRDLIEHDNPWLSQVVTPQHFENFSIYRSG